MTQKVDINEAKAIINWVNVNEDIREFSLKYGELELFISRNPQSSAAPAAAPVQAAPSSPSTAAVPTSPAAPAAANAPVPAAAPVATDAGEYQPGVDEIVIRAPMVGTFYSAPKPGDPAFVKEGDHVTASSVLCIIEVMKLMNSIEAGVDGVVTQILVHNEQPVEYNQPLMVIKRQA